MDSLLSAEELCFFKTYGYLVKKRALVREHCARVLDRMWQTAPPSIRREDPTTWKAVPAEEESRRSSAAHTGHALAVSGGVL